MEYNQTNVCPVCNKNSKDVIHTRQVCDNCLFIYGTTDKDDNSVIFFRSKTSPKLLVERDGIVYDNMYECYVKGIHCMATILFDKLIIVSTISIPKNNKTNLETISEYDY